MRRCIVDKCTNSDNIILCHRFPRNRELARKWQISLNLTDRSLDTLVSKYAVCCLHFDRSDYRNSLSNSLNATALPRLEGVNPRPHTVNRNKSIQLETQNSSTYEWTEFENKESHSPLNDSDSIELLHRDDSDSVTEVDDSLASPPGSSNEICILPEEPNATDDLIDGAGFTILDAAGCGMFMPAGSGNQQHDGSDESSAFVLESGNSSGDAPEFRPSSTDSDVEVLVSEAIFESNWSEKDHLAVQNKGQTNASDSTVSPCISYQSDLSTKTNEAGPDAEYGHLDKAQLLDIIKNQSSQIQQLEDKLGTFKSAQEQLITHFEAFRKSVCGVHP